VPALLFLVVWIAQQALFAYFDLAGTGEGGVAYFAHIGGFVFGLVVYGITSYRTRIPSRSAGLALSAFVVPWVVLLGAGFVYEGAAPAWIDFATTSVMGILLLVIGYLTRAESPPAEREEPIPDATA
jgi:membrane associated rhomboid family serine protease